MGDRLRSCGETYAVGALGLARRAKGSKATFCRFHPRGMESVRRTGEGARRRRRARCPFRVRGILFQRRGGHRAKVEASARGSPSWRGRWRVFGRRRRKRHGTALTPAGFPTGCAREPAFLLPAVAWGMRAFCIHARPACSSRRAAGKRERRAKPHSRCRLWKTQKTTPGSSPWRPGPRFGPSRRPFGEDRRAAGRTRPESSADARRSRRAATHQRALSTRCALLASSAP